MAGLRSSCWGEYSLSKAGITSALRLSVSKNEEDLIFTWPDLAIHLSDNDIHFAFLSTGVHSQVQV